MGGTARDPGRQPRRARRKCDLPDRSPGALLLWHARAGFAAFGAFGAEGESEAERRVPAARREPRGPAAGKGGEPAAAEARTCTANRHVRSPDGRHRWNAALDGDFSERASRQARGARLSESRGTGLLAGTVFPDHKHGVDKVDAVRVGPLPCDHLRSRRDARPGNGWRTGGVTHSAVVQGDEPGRAHAVKATAFGDARDAALSSMTADAHRREESLCRPAPTTFQRGVRCGWRLSVPGEWAGTSGPVWGGRFGTSRSSPVRATRRHPASRRFSRCPQCPPCTASASRDERFRPLDRRSSRPAVRSGPFRR